MSQKTKILLGVVAAVIVWHYTMQARQKGQTA